MKRFVFLVLTVAAILNSANVMAQVSNRDFSDNVSIPGLSSDGTQVDYILLYPAYNGQPISEHFVFGTFSAIRGNEGSWNRKWTVQVNASSSYVTDRGSIISYNESSRLVTLFYQGVKYVAVQIALGSTMAQFQFHGWMYGTTFKLVKTADVTSVQNLQSYDPITIPTALVIDNSGTPLNTANPSIYKSDAMILNSSVGGMRISAPSSTENLFTGGHHILMVSPNYDGGMGFSVGQHNSGFIQAFSNTAENGTLFLNPNGGNVGIGVHDTKGHKLAVGGDIIAEKVIVKNQTNWPDYVFERNYHLPTLQEVAAYINTNKHLPDMPAATEIKASGVDLEAMNAKLLQKVEELTLYLIQLDKENKALKEEVKAIKAAIKQ